MKIELVWFWMSVFLRRRCRGKCCAAKAKMVTLDRGFCFVSGLLASGVLECTLGWLVVVIESE